MQPKTVRGFICSIKEYQHRAQRSTLRAHTPCAACSTGVCPLARLAARREDGAGMSPGARCRHAGATGRAPGGLGGWCGTEKQQKAPMFPAARKLLAHTGAYRSRTARRAFASSPAVAPAGAPTTAWRTRGWGRARGSQAHTRVRAAHPLRVCAGTAQVGRRGRGVPALPARLGVHACAFTGTSARGMAAMPREQRRGWMSTSSARACGLQHRLRPGSCLAAREGRVHAMQVEGVACCGRRRAAHACRTVREAGEAGRRGRPGSTKTGGVAAPPRRRKLGAKVVRLVPLEWWFGASSNREGGWP